VLMSGVRWVLLKLNALKLRRAQQQRQEGIIKGLTSGA